MRYVSHWPLGVPLLWLAVYLPDGTLRKLGSRRLFAYTRRKVLGMRTPATAITAVCSSLVRRGNPWGVRRSRTLRARVNSYSGHGLSGDATATRGASGERRERAACDEHDWRYDADETERGPWTGYIERCAKCDAISQVPV